MSAQAGDWSPQGSLPSRARFVGDDDTMADGGTSKITRKRDGCFTCRYVVPLLRCSQSIKIDPSLQNTKKTLSYTSLPNALAIGSMRCMQTTLH